MTEIGNKYAVFFSEISPRTVNGFGYLGPNSCRSEQKYRETVSQGKTYIVKGVNPSVPH